MAKETEIFNFERPESARPGIPTKRPTRRPVPLIRPLPTFPQPVREPIPTLPPERLPIKEPVPVHTSGK